MLMKMDFHLKEDYNIMQTPYSKLLNESTGTMKKYPPKIQAVRTFFAVLLQLFQVNGVLEN